MQLNSLGMFGRPDLQMPALNSSVHMETGHVSELKSPEVGGLRSYHSPSVVPSRSRNLHALIYEKGVSLLRVSVRPVQYKHSRDLFRQKSPRGRQSQTKESAWLHSEHCEGPRRSRHHWPWPESWPPGKARLFSFFSGLTKKCQVFNNNFKNAGFGNLAFSKVWNLDKWDLVINRQ